MGTTVIERLLDETMVDEARERLRESRHALEAGAAVLAKEMQERLPDHLPTLQLDEDLRGGLEQALRWPAQHGLPWPVPARKASWLDRLRGLGLLRWVGLSVLLATMAALLAYGGVTLLRRQRRAARRAARRARQQGGGNGSGGNGSAAYHSAAERERVAVAIEPAEGLVGDAAVAIEEGVGEA